MGQMHPTATEVLLHLGKARRLWLSSVRLACVEMERNFPVHRSLFGRDKITAVKEDFSSNSRSSTCILDGNGLVRQVKSNV